eukprot:CAMPEP_0177647912 /NCGR_PEP_ID=MMETSP0447-20121125/10549_1 /TAXON_ID=0 /ORGANISM="Stygamoeba regulata, Strain BSH-02190019" /LENGTH=139 /DNA_ID=CAMNT_0019150521 /DNA_START=46 /DNA_END=462 /DNA_ORIENTATION=+
METADNPENDRVDPQVMELVLQRLQEKLKQKFEAAATDQPTSFLFQVDGPCSGSEDVDDGDGLIGEEEEEDDGLGSLESDEEEQDEEEQDPAYNDNVVLCQFEKVSRNKAKWKCVLKDGVMHINDTDYVFSKSNGEFDW